MDKWAEIFSERLFELVDGSEFTLEEIANHLCVSVNMLERLMRGVSRPKARILTKICTFFHVSADYMLGLRDGK